jgi:hypothetical protein
MNKKSNTKPSLTFLVLLFISSIIHSQTQTVQVNGKLQVSNVPTNATATDMIVIDGAGNLGKKPAPSDNQMLSISTSGDTVKLQNGGFIIIPGISARSLPLAYDGNGNSYKPVPLANKVYLQQSLATKYNDGTPIPKITDLAEWQAATTPAYCWYNNDSLANYQFGPLYNGYVKDLVATGGKNVCPVGYHVMKKSDWLPLTGFIPKAIRSSSFQEWNNPGGNLLELNLKGTGQRRHDSGAFNQRKENYYTWLTESALTECGAVYDNNVLGIILDIAWPLGLKAGLGIMCAKD